jgi:putative alpha-1,2-mannosidase
MGILTALAAVASMAGRHDVAKVVLATLADWNNVFDLQISTRAAVGACVIEVPPSP